MGASGHVSAFAKYGQAMKLRQKILSLAVGILILASWPAGKASGQAEPGPTGGGRQITELPVTVESALDYLLRLIGRRAEPFDSSRVNELLDFSAIGHGDERQVRPEERSSGQGVYLHLDVNAPLKRILHYAYNPSIPNYIVYPRVLRLCGWYPESDIIAGKYQLWDKLKDLRAPLVLHGKEFEVNTPDSFSGAYYRYDNYRMLILLPYKKGHALISVSRMSDKSQVGKKAVIIDEQNWNYFYSGIDGLNLRFIGGLDTYLYRSESVTIYYQTDDARPVTTISLFKWLNAGWAGLNVVKPTHIYTGSLRFTQGLKTVMESNRLPDPDTLARQMRYIRSLSPAEMDSKIREYALNFERIARSHKGMGRQDFADIIADGGYANVLDQEERVGVLVLESLKKYMGKPALVRLGTASALDPHKISMIRSGRPRQREVNEKHAARIN